MKPIASPFAFIIGFIMLGSTAIAQDDIRVPLSEPGQPGTLYINTVYSDEIQIRAHDENDFVLVNYNGEGNEDDEDNMRNGLRRISGNGVGLEVTEENNEVRIRTNPMPGDLELVVYVPRRFSVKLNATQGDIYVEGLEGEMEVSATNGDVELMNLSGSVVVNSVNGDITVDMVQVASGVPMSFTGVNGDIEISLPADTKFSAKMKTEWGDVYTNFDINMNRSPQKEVSQDRGTYKVAVNKWLFGDVNGGGPEYLFKTLHGDISIRKK